MLFVRCTAIALSVTIGTIECAELVPIKRLRNEAFAGSYGGQLAYSPDGALIAVGYYRIGIWNARTGQKVHQFDGHPKEVVSEGGVSGMEFTSDSKTLISCGHDGAVRFWDIKTGKLSRELLAPWILVDPGGQLALQRAPLHSISISPDNHILAASAHDWTIRLWELETGKYVGSLGTSQFEKVDAGSLRNPIDSEESDPTIEYWKLPNYFLRERPDVCFSPDGQLLAAVEYKKVSIWDVSNRKLQSTLTSGGNGLFSPNGDLFVTARYEGVTVWNPKSGLLVRNFTDPVKDFTPLQFSPDGKILATGSDGGVGIRLWDIESGKLIRSVAFGGEALDAIRFSPDGTRLAATVRRHQVHIFDLASGRKLFGDAHTDTVEKLAFSTDSRFLISGSDDSSVRVWDAQSWELKNSLIQPDMYVSALLPLDDPQRVLVGDSSGVTRLLRIPALETELTLNHADDVAGYAFVGDRLFVGIDDVRATVETWDWKTRKLLSSDIQHRTYHLLMANSRDHSIGATADYDGNVIVWENIPTIHLAEFKIDGNHTSAIAVSPDGKNLATIGSKEAWQILQIWDPRTGKEVHRATPGGSHITEAVWSPDGKMLAMTSMGEPGLYLLEANQMQEVGDTAHNHSLAFSPDGKLLAAGDEEGQIMVWRVSQ